MVEEEEAGAVEAEAAAAGEEEAWVAGVARGVEEEAGVGRADTAAHPVAPARVARLLLRLSRLGHDVIATAARDVHRGGEEVRGGHRRVHT